MDTCDPLLPQLEAQRREDDEHSPHVQTGQGNWEPLVAALALSRPPAQPARQGGDGVRISPWLGMPIVARAQCRRNVTPHLAASQERCAERTRVEWRLWCKVRGCLSCWGGALRASGSGHKMGHTFRIHTARCLQLVLLLLIRWSVPVDCRLQARWQVCGDHWFGGAPGAPELTSFAGSDPQPKTEVRSPLHAGPCGSNNRLYWNELLARNVSGDSVTLLAFLPEMERFWQPTHNEMREVANGKRQCDVHLWQPRAVAVKTASLPLRAGGFGLFNSIKLRDHAFIDMVGARRRGALTWLRMLVWAERCVEYWWTKESTISWTRRTPESRPNLHSSKSASVVAWVSCSRVRTPLTGHASALARRVEAIGADTNKMSDRVLNMISEKIALRVVSRLTWEVMEVRLLRPKCGLRISSPRGLMCGCLRLTPHADWQEMLDVCGLDRGDCWAWRYFPKCVFSRPPPLCTNVLPTNVANPKLCLKARPHAVEVPSKDDKRPVAPTRNVLGVLYEEWVPEVYGSLLSSLIRNAGGQDRPRPYHSAKRRGWGDGLPERYVCEDVQRITQEAHTRMGTHALYVHATPNHHARHFTLRTRSTGAFLHMLDHSQPSFAVISESYESPMTQVWIHSDWPDAFHQKAFMNFFGKVGPGEVERRESFSRCHERLLTHSGESCLLRRIWQ
eukprot:scaffold751_cov395-Prasinococcus_capsulatus_cf.AAC.18